MFRYNFEGSKFFYYQFMFYKHIFIKVFYVLTTILFYLFYLFTYIF